MPPPRLLLDEDVRAQLAIILRDVDTMSATSVN